MGVKKLASKPSRNSCAAADSHLREAELLAPQKLTEISRSQLGLVLPESPGSARPFYSLGVAVTEANLCDWIASALVGHCIQYHEGLLLRDRSETSSDLAPQDRARIHAVARRAWIACELGLVHLFSQKVGENHYRYLAMRSGSTLKPASIRHQLLEGQMATSNRKPH